MCDGAPLIYYWSLQFHLGLDIEQHLFLDSSIYVREKATMSNSNIMLGFGIEYVPYLEYFRILSAAVADEGGI